MYAKYLGSTGNNKNKWEGLILLWKGGYNHPQKTLIGLPNYGNKI